MRISTSEKIGVIAAITSRKASSLSRRFSTELGIVFFSMSLLFSSVGMAVHLLTVFSQFQLLWIGLRFRFGLGNGFNFGFGFALCDRFGLLAAPACILVFTLLLAQRYKLVCERRGVGDQPIKTIAIGFLAPDVRVQGRG